VTLERASSGYDGREVVAGVEMSLAPGDRVGLLGRNGAGKSTLTRLLAGLAAPLAGRRTAAQDLVIGYFAQHQLEQLEPDASPLAHLRRHGGTALAQATEQEQRSFLGGFGFAGERVFEPVAPFSGGEKARLVLALIVSRRPNLLLLDEPTNHLDLEMRHALAMALQAYDGAIVLVSHDRFLLRMVADTLWLVAGGRAVPYDGDLDDYAAWLQAGAAATEAEAPRAAPVRGAAADKERKRREAEHRQRLAPLKSAVERSERELAALAAELAAIEARLADPALHLPAARTELVELLARQGALKRRVVEVEEAWLEASEALESARAGA
jgi:ATP-binding cassette subfamily F protein 3